MISRIKNFWSIISDSLWFLPVLICLVYFATTLGVLFLEMHFWQIEDLSSFFYAGKTQDAQELLAPLLTSMITMATLALSITMVVLSLAASQLGPRIIRSFMGDHKTQLYIGMFLGSVISCFVLARILHDSSLSADTPRMTITYVFGLCFANLFALLGFVHHIAQSSIADHIVTQISEKLNARISALPDRNPEGLSDDKKEKRKQKEKALEDLRKQNAKIKFNTGTKKIAFIKSGYVQYIQYRRLADIAEDYECVIKINCRAGHYIVRGENSVIVKTKHEIDNHFIDKVMGCFIIGHAKTSSQDIEYSLRHMVEIGLRALSPGINDHFTAMTVLDRLSSALAHLFEKETPEHLYADDEGNLRVVGESESIQDIIFHVFSQITDAGQDKPDIISHSLNRLHTLKTIASTQSEKKALTKQISILEEYIKGNVKQGIVRKDLESRL